MAGLILPPGQAQVTQKTDSAPLWQPAQMIPQNKKKPPKKKKGGSAYQTHKPGAYPQAAVYRGD